MVLFQNWSFFQVLFFRQNRAGECLLRYSRTRKLFLGYKKTNFKKPKNCHFSKGVNPWFWSKTGHFSNFFFFRQNRAGECLLRYSRTRKLFLGYKKTNFKKPKNCHFSKGVNPWFWSKTGHFSNFFFFRQNRAGECLLRYSETKKLLCML